MPNCTVMHYVHYRTRSGIFIFFISVPEANAGRSGIFAFSVSMSTYLIDGKIDIEVSANLDMDLL